ncbi:diphosphomevalonate decarboxylase [Aquibacillus rhizosphaerae]|uniref:diphosphomevalonate decarboxylase n=1 Tax=Aquibacillus rhizosphaerae TaxID=3051431 RepID=A0ABT7L2U1_9BACI|nr:diphosphomevalonate decarboxylase [Aquibacillus sp. LR5S19]MDL4840183.1 diphosphomevalonate decarboxylase [Aquibacillus sp. LR5S19]
MEAIAKAHTNIALIKYWGKRDETLFLPMNSSLSITLDRFYTTTAVQFCSCLNKDVFLLNGQIASEAETMKIVAFLDHVRNIAGKNMYAIVNSVNKVPTAAGFASSASGFAALAAAATKAIGMDTDNKTLSQIARQGSGSACRSIYGGYVEWQKGEEVDGSDSFAKPISDKQDWNLSVLSCLVASNEKKVLSREGMKRTVETSPFYKGWLDTVEKDLVQAKRAIAERDFEMLGTVVEANALKMHATTLGANPPFMYWQSATLEVMEHVQQLRTSGIEAYFTIDAGPNVKVICHQKDEQAVLEHLATLPSVQNVYLCHPGPGISYLPDTATENGSKLFYKTYHQSNCENKTSHT